MFNILTTFEHREEASNIPKNKTNAKSIYLDPILTIVYFLTIIYPGYKKI